MLFPEAVRLFRGGGGAVRCEQAAGEFVQRAGLLAGERREQLVLGVFYRL